LLADAADDPALAAANEGRRHSSNGGAAGKRSWSCRPCRPSRVHRARGRLEARGRVVTRRLRHPARGCGELGRRGALFSSSLSPSSDWWAVDRREIQALVWPRARAPPPLGKTARSTARCRRAREGAGQLPAARRAPLWPRVDCRRRKESRRRRTAPLVPRRAGGRGRSASHRDRIPLDSFEQLGQPGARTSPLLHHLIAPGVPRRLDHVPRECDRRNRSRVTAPGLLDFSADGVQPRRAWRGRPDR